MAPLFLPRLIGVCVVCVHWVVRRGLLGADAVLNMSNADIDTPMLQPWVAGSPEFAAYLDAGIALGHLGNPADVAGAAAWLASGRESGYVTGAVIPVDGGFTAR